MPFILFWCFLQNTVFDYYQAVTIYDEVILALGVSWSLAIVLYLTVTLKAKQFSLSYLRTLASFGLILVLGIPVV